MPPSREHYENAYTLTLLYMPPPDRVARAERALLETGDEEQARDWRQELTAFVAETERVLDLLPASCRRSTRSMMRETLTYLHGTISSKRHTHRRSRNAALSRRHPGRRTA